jgi:hypothetical protein
MGGHVGFERLGSRRLSPYGRGGGRVAGIMVRFADSRSPQRKRPPGVNGPWSD